MIMKFFRFSTFLVLIFNSFLLSSYSFASISITLSPRQLCDIELLFSGACQLLVDLGYEEEIWWIGKIFIYKINKRVRWESLYEHKNVECVFIDYAIFNFVYGLWWTSSYCCSSWLVQVVVCAYGAMVNMVYSYWH